MSHDGIVRAGHEAWLPCDEASDLVIFHLDHAPSMGTFDVGDTRVAFRCLTGRLDTISVWAYACLSREESEDLENRTYPDLESMQSYFDELLSNRRVVFATAHDMIVDTWADLPVGDHVLTGAIHFLQQVRASRTPSHAQRSDEQAEVDAAARELQVSGV